MGALFRALAAPVDNNLETFSLVWLDAEVNKTQENIVAQQQLRTSINHLKTFKDHGECECHIRSVSTQDRIVLIVSGRLGQEIVPRIHNLRQVSSIYVYCTDKKRNEEWANEYIKVRDVIIELDLLISRIRTDHTKRIPKKIDESLSMNVFDLSAGYGQSITELNGQFIHSQLLIDCLLHMTSTSTDRDQLISLANEEYKDNRTELVILREFERDYFPNRAVWWYTRDSFLYRQLNKALRVQNTDLLFLFRFFIRDIEQQLETYRCSEPIRLYRGQLMSNDEVQMLRDSIGNLISINSFLSTSINRQLALFYLTDSIPSIGLQCVLFEIDADPRLPHVKPLANVTSLSYFPEEEEVLIMLGSIFRLVDIVRDDKRVWIIRMILCGENDYDLKPILEYMRNDYIDQKAILFSFGNVLVKMGKFDKAEKYYDRLLNQLPNDHENIDRCYSALGTVARQKGDYESSLEWHHKSLEIKMRTLASNDPNLASNYISIGAVCDDKGDFKCALESYDKALIILKEAYGENHLRVATCFNNIGNIYQQTKKYSEALNYHQKALTIEEHSLPMYHPYLGQSHHNIGNVYYALGNYDIALQHYHKALEIKSKSLPPHHPEIATTLNNIGLIHEKIHHLQEALAFFDKALTIRCRALPSKHPDIVQTKRDIRRVSSTLDFMNSTYI